MKNAVYRNVYYNRSIYYDKRKVPMSTEAHAHRFIFSFILILALVMYFMFQILLYNMKRRHVPLQFPEQT